MFFFVVKQFTGETPVLVFFFWINVHAKSGEYMVGRVCAATTIRPTILLLN
ncbi:hypothetical protein LR1_06000 [Lacticaseibacillus rhamnosus DSM 20021 = JCM 1136 = NBRC 3425]|nr:hypothetical protein LR1_06000 [Lacticaseibacillus rhamnosus DSM 20021 = JCM 1136 = NBRC 3425]